jgi:hypothetical protein
MLANSLSMEDEEAVAAELLELQTSIVCWLLLFALHRLRKNVTARRPGGTAYPFTRRAHPLTTGPHPRACCAGRGTRYICIGYTSLVSPIFWILQNGKELL